jgi:hypothetical protein
MHGKDKRKKIPFDHVVEIPYYVNPLLRKIRWYLEIYDQHLTFKNGIYSHKITKIIDEFKPDVIHCHFGYQALKLLDNFDYKDIPVVVTFHGYDATFKFHRKSYVQSIKKHFENDNVHVFLACEFFKENFIKIIFLLKRRAWFIAASTSTISGEPDMTCRQRHSSLYRFQAFIPRKDITIPCLLLKSCLMRILILTAN